jgi:hypothetical protein
VRRALALPLLALLAGCGGTSDDARSSFGQHLRKDGLVLYRISAVLQPPSTNQTSPARRIRLWTAELRAAEPRIHAATVDLASVRPPADARADTRAILKGFRFADRLVAQLARDVGRRDRAATLRDLRPDRSNRVFASFRAAVRDLQRKSYDVGVLNR